MLVGYARVSSTGQSLDIQEAQLRAAGCDKIFAEKASASSTTGRDALADVLDFVREGDTLVVTRLDRLARSVVDLHETVERLVAKGVSFRCLQQGGVDTTTSAGKLTLAILAAVAEFETDLRRERQREGIEKAKARGVYRGRPPSIDPGEIRRLHSEGLGATEISRHLGVGRASVYRILKQAA